MRRAVDAYRVAGTLLCPLGVAAWDPASDMALLRPSLKPNVWTLRVEKLPAGQYEFKINVNGNWDLSYGKDGNSNPGCSNIVVHVAKESDVLVFFDSVTHKTECEILEPRTTSGSNSSSPVKPTRSSMRSGSSISAFRREDLAARNKRADMHIELVWVAEQWATRRRMRSEEKARELANKVWCSVKAGAMSSLFEKPNMQPVMPAETEEEQQQQQQPSVQQQPKETTIKVTTVPVTENSPTGCTYIMEVFKSVFRPVCGASLCGSNENNANNNMNNNTTSNTIIQSTH